MNRRNLKTADNHEEEANRSIKKKRNSKIRFKESNTRLTPSINNEDKLSTYNLDIKKKSTLMLSNFNVSKVEVNDDSDLKKEDSSNNNLIMENTNNKTLDLLNDMINFRRTKTSKTLGEYKEFKDYKNQELNKLNENYKKTLKAQSKVNNDSYTADNYYYPVIRDMDVEKDELNDNENENDNNKFNIKAESGKYKNKSKTKLNNFIFPKYSNDSLYLSKQSKGSRSKEKIENNKYNKLINKNYQLNKEKNQAREKELENINASKINNKSKASFFSQSQMNDTIKAKSQANASNYSNSKLFQNISQYSNYVEKSGSSTSMTSKGKKSRLRKIIDRFANFWLFNPLGILLFHIIILLDALTYIIYMNLEEGSTGRTALKVIDNTYTVIYLIEPLLTVYAYCKEKEVNKDQFKPRIVNLIWNGTVLLELIHPSFTFFRLLRYIRIFYLIALFQQLNTIATMLIGPLKEFSGILLSIIYLLALISIFFTIVYSSGKIGICSYSPEPKNGSINDIPIDLYEELNRQYFNPNSFLFSLSNMTNNNSDTGDSHHRRLYDQSDNYYNNNYFQDYLSIYKDRVLSGAVDHSNITSNVILDLAKNKTEWNIRKFIHYTFQNNFCKLDENWHCPANSYCSNVKEAGQFYFLTNKDFNDVKYSTYISGVNSMKSFFYSFLVANLDGWSHFYDISIDVLSPTLVFIHWFFIILFINMILIKFPIGIMVNAGMVNDSITCRKEKIREAILTEIEGAMGDSEQDVNHFEIQLKVFERLQNFFSVLKNFHYLKRIEPFYEFHSKWNLSFACYYLMKQPLTNIIISIISTLNLFFLAFETDLKGSPINILYKVVILVVYFLASLTIFIGELRYVFLKKSFLFDTLILVLSLVEFMISRTIFFSSLYSLRSISFLFYLKELKTLGVAYRIIMETSKEIYKYCAVVAIFTIYFMIAGQFLYKDKLKYITYNSLDQRVSNDVEFNINVQSKTHFYYKIFDSIRGESPILNFDNTYNSFLTVFNLFIGDSWNTVFEDAYYCESVHYVYTYTYFIFAIFIMKIWMFNLSLAILIHQFEKSRKTNMFHKILYEFTQKQKGLRLKRTHSFSFKNRIELRQYVEMEEEEEETTSLIKQPTKPMMKLSDARLRLSYYDIPKLNSPNNNKKKNDNGISKPMFSSILLKSNSIDNNNRPSALNNITHANYNNKSQRKSSKDKKTASSRSRRSNNSSSQDSSSKDDNNEEVDLDINIKPTFSKQSPNKLRRKSFAAQTVKRNSVSQRNASIANENNNISTISKIYAGNKNNSQQAKENESLGNISLIKRASKYQYNYNEESKKSSDKQFHTNDSLRANSFFKSTFTESKPKAHKKEENKNFSGLNDNIELLGGNKTGERYKNSESQAINNRSSYRNKNSHRTKNGDVNNANTPMIKRKYKLSALLDELTSVPSLKAIQNEEFHPKQYQNYQVRNSILETAQITKNNSPAIINKYYGHRFTQVSTKNSNATDNRKISNISSAMKVGDISSINNFSKSKSRIENLKENNETNDNDDYNSPEKSGIFNFNNFNNKANHIISINANNNNNNNNNKAISHKKSNEQGVFPLLPINLKANNNRTVNSSDSPNDDSSNFDKKIENKKKDSNENKLKQRAISNIDDPINLINSVYRKLTEENANSLKPLKDLNTLNDKLKLKNERKKSSTNTNNKSNKTSKRSKNKTNTNNIDNDYLMNNMNKDIQLKKDKNSRARLLSDPFPSPSREQKTKYKTNNLNKYLSNKLLTGEEINRKELKENKDKDKNKDKEKKDNNTKDLTNILTSNTSTKSKIKTTLNSLKSSNDVLLAKTMLIDNRESRLKDTNKMASNQPRQRSLPKIYLGKAFREMRSLKVKMRKINSDNALSRLNIVKELEDEHIVQDNTNSANESNNNLNEADNQIKRAEKINNYLRSETFKSIKEVQSNLQVSRKISKLTSKKHSNKKLLSNKTSNMKLNYSYLDSNLVNFRGTKQNSMMKSFKKQPESEYMHWPDYYSFLIFHRDSWFRESLVKLFENKWVDNFILGMIFLNLILVMIDTPYVHPESNMYNSIMYIDDFLTIFFFVEMVMRMIGWGFYFDYKGNISDIFCFKMCKKKKKVTSDILFSNTSTLKIPSNVPSSKQSMKGKFKSSFMMSSNKSKIEVSTIRNKNCNAAGSTERGIIRDVLNIIDACVNTYALILLLFMKISTSNDFLDSIKSFKALIALRPLVMIKRSKSLKRLVNSVFKAIPMIFNVFIIILYIITIISIIGHNFFVGKLGICSDSNYSNRQDCVDAGFDWKQGDYNYDRVFSVNLIIFELASKESWFKIVHQTLVNSDNYKLYSFYFIIIMIICGVFLINLAHAVIIDSFKQTIEQSINKFHVSSKFEKDYFFTVEQFTFFAPKKLLWYQKDSSSIEKLLIRLIKTKTLQKFSLFLNVLITFLYLLYHKDQGDYLTNLQTTVFIVHYIVALLILVIKFGLYGWKYCIKNYNWFFDFIALMTMLIAFTIRELIADNMFSAFLLFTRLFYCYKLIKFSKSLTEVIYTIKTMIPKLLGIMFLLFMGLLVFSAVAMSYFGKSKQGEFISDSNNFINFPHSAMLLLKCLIGGNWNRLMRELGTELPGCVKKQSYNDLFVFGPQTCGDYKSWFFFVFFVIVCKILIMKLFVAVFVEHFISKKDKEKFINKEDVKAFYTLWSMYDKDCNFEIPCDQFILFCLQLGSPFNELFKDILYSNGCIKGRFVVSPDNKLILDYYSVIRVSWLLNGVKVTKRGTVHLGSAIEFLVFKLLVGDLEDDYYQE